jgi:hypothetical protein
MAIQEQGLHPSMILTRNNPILITTAGPSTPPGPLPHCPWNGDSAAIREKIAQCSSLKIPLLAFAMDNTRGPFSAATTDHPIRQLAAPV